MPSEHTPRVSLVVVDMVWYSLDTVAPCPAVCQAVESPSNLKPVFQIKIIIPGIERVQALADILRSALCCRSNEACAPIANLPNSAKLESTPYHSPNLHPAPCSSVEIWRGTNRQTQTAVTNIHFASTMPHAKCN